MDKLERRINLASTNEPEPPEYLEDPESHPEPWPEEIWADNEEQARYRCQILAKSYRVCLMKIERRSKHSKRWDCVFQPYE